ncbi:MAG: pentapeptide repeat-containing protein [Pseudomonadota bacterium]
MGAAILVIVRSFPVQRRPAITISGGVNLRGAFLRGLRLPLGSDLSSFDLTGSNLREAKLRECTFSNSILDGVDFSDAELVRSDFSNASAVNANFVGARITMAITESMQREAQAPLLNT